MEGSQEGWWVGAQLGMEAAPMMEVLVEDQGGAEEA